MTSTISPPDESVRLAVLRHYEVLDTQPEQSLDDLTMLAAQICAAPIALITLIDERREFIQSKVGFDPVEIPREFSFGAHALQQSALLIVGDAAQDARFARNPQVTGEPGIRFYAGAPLVTPEGTVLGTLCVLDRVPRTLTPAQERALQILSRQVMAQLELRRRTTALAASEARYRALFEYAPDGILIADAGSIYLDSNPSMCRMLGYRREELIGRHASEIVMPEEIPHIALALDAIHSGSDHHREWRFRRKDGSTFPAEVLATQMPDGNLFGMVRDITERKQAEIAARKLVALVESSQDAIIGKDVNGIVTSWNLGAEKIFGYTAGEMIGTPILRLIPAGRQDEERQILAKIGRGEVVEHFETQRQTKDGRLIEVSVTASPIRDSTGRVVGASKIARDITVLKAREREIARLSRLYAALSQVNQAIVWMPTREKLFEKICRVLVEFGGFGMAWIGWIDAATQRVVPVAEFGDENAYLQSIQIYTDERAEGRGPTGTAFRVGWPYVCNDMFNDPVTLPWRSEVERRGWRASAAFPIRTQDKVCGTLTVYSDVAGFFRDKEIALLEEAAGDISFALDNLAREEARRLGEEALQSEKAFSDTMIESMPGILYFYDDQGRFLRWNRNFETVSGYSGNEIAQMRATDFFAKEDQPLVQDRIVEVFSSGESSIEAPFLAKDGRRTPYFFTGRRVMFEGKACLIGMGIDISQRRQAEDLLAESERKYRELVEHANSIILRWNSDGRITLLNEFGQRFFGYSAEEIIGRNVMETIVPAAESSGRDLQSLMELICANPAAFEQNVNENIRRNGERVWISWSNRIERDDQGRVVGILSIGTDITEQRKAEKAVRELNANLEHRVTERTLELQTALIRAESADRLKSAFLATMSHELRTPLNSIIGFTGTVLAGLPGPLNDEQKKQLGMVRTSARHLLELINDVLDLSKIEAGQLQVRSEPFDLRAALERVTGLVKVLADKKGLSLTKVVSPEVGEMVSDRRRVEQILLNLLNNAIKFTDRGEVTLTARLVADFCPVPGARPRPAVCLEVTDTGIGIRPENLATLFQPFRQVDTGLARQHEGTGLGLAICRRLVELLGGTISVSSSWSQGSTFGVVLPLQPISVS